MNEEDEQDIYSEDGVESYMDDDEIAEREEGFMVGYLGA